MVQLAHVMGPDKNYVLMVVDFNGFNIFGESGWKVRPHGVDGAALCATTPAGFGVDDNAL